MTTPSFDLREFKGTSQEVINAVLDAELPSFWGNASIVKAYIIDHVPMGSTWYGLVRVVAFRTTPDGTGKGEHRLSVTWEPKPKPGA